MSITSHHQVDRSRVNESVVNVANLPKSGFNKSYKSYSTFTLGKLHVGGYHYVMPADKFRGSNNASLTFFRLNQPNVSDVNISQHNFYLPFRSIDNTFEDAFAPNPNNAMSASWTAPGFSIADVTKLLFGYIEDSVKTALNTDFLSNVKLTPNSVCSTECISALNSLINSTATFTSLRLDFTNHYCSDFVDSCYIPRVTALLKSITGSTTYIDAFRIFIDAWLFPFVGEGSLLDELGFIYIRRADLYSITGIGFSDVADIYTLFSNIKQNEYAIRAYYTVWYEYYRDNNLEPRRSTLSDWHKFGSTSVVVSGTVLHPSMLINRFRSWSKDVFTTSMPDDIMRHVFAPITTTANSSATGNSLNTIGVDMTSTDFLNAEKLYGVGNFSARNILNYKLTYTDPITNQITSINCPLPAQVNDVLVSSTPNNYYVSALDLFSLRNAQSLERYLKRNFYFGDEYRDRMLAHYGSYVSDMRVNRPEFLSSSISPINPNQVLSSAGSETTPQGERNMTITASTSDDTYNFYAEEFGIVLNLISIMPVAQYAGVCPQNMLSKVTDYPIPEFAANNEEFSRVYEIAFSALAANQERIKPTFGHHPYAHNWRARVNEVHKEYLSDLQEYTFRRFFGMDDDGRVPLLNSNFIHCRPNLGMFVGGHDTLYTPQVYGVINHAFYVESVLPTPVETI